eukprot:s2630_g2.t1
MPGTLSQLAVGADFPVPAPGLRRLAAEPLGKRTTEKGQLEEAAGSGSRVEWPFALRVRPWLIFVFASLAAVAVARLALLDLTGGFFLVLAVVMGYLAIRKGMNIAWLLCLAMILFLNSLLDGFLVVALGMRTDWRFFFQKQPWYLLLGRLLTVAGPVLEFLGAWLCWGVYKDHLAHMPSSEVFLVDSEQPIQAPSYQATDARLFLTWLCGLVQGFPRSPPALWRHHDALQPLPATPTGWAKNAQALNTVLEEAERALPEPGYAGVTPRRRDDPRTSGFSFLGGGLERGLFRIVEASRIPVSFGGHGHHAPANADEALAQAKAGLQTCALGFMASSAALLSAYVTWSLEKETLVVLEVGVCGSRASSAAWSWSRYAALSLQRDRSCFGVGWRGAPTTSSWRLADCGARSPG